MEHYSNVVKAMIARSNARAADIADKIQARAYYQFQYVPPAGPLPGWSMEQQTEDAINEIGNIAYSSDEIAREAAVYYPKGVAPSLTANASNIINVVAIVDDTDSFSIQVCDVVALPYRG